jgi:2-iminobutanoate/2-iminopropanoate deaminase
VTTIQRHAHPSPLPLSRAVEVGGFLLLSGQLAVNAEGKLAGDDIRSQTRLVLDRIEETLQSLGARMDQVVKSTVWLADMNDFVGFNEEYRGRFAGGYPARSTVEAKLVGGALVEIEVMAWVGPRGQTAGH